MRRRRRSENVKDYSAREVNSAVLTRMNMRTTQLAPIPVTPLDIYRHLWSKEERAAIRVLKSMKTILHMDTDLTLQWAKAPFVAQMTGGVHTGASGAYAPTAIFISFHGKELPLPSTESWRTGADKMMIDRLPPSMLEAIELWAQGWVLRDLEAKRVMGKVEQVFNHCNTMGQIHRLWPNLCSFLPESGQQIVRNIKVKSRLPDGFDPLPAEWTPEALRPFDDLITEALMLPYLDVPAQPIHVVYSRV